MQGWIAIWRCWNEGVNKSRITAAGVPGDYNCPALALCSLRFSCVARGNRYLEKHFNI